MLLALFALLTPISFASEGVPATNCVKVSLFAIYGAEKSYHSEYEAYSDSFEAIGFSPDPQECKGWQGSVRVFSGGQEFLATYIKPSTGETWTINEKKVLRQEHEGRKD